MNDIAYDIMEVEIQAANKKLIAEWKLEQMQGREYAQPGEGRRLYPADAGADKLDNFEPPVGIR